MILDQTAIGPTRNEETDRAIADLVACGSIEMNAHRAADAREIAALLPTGTPVYVNHLPRHALADTLAALLVARAAGLEPVPHIAARRLSSRDELGNFLQRAVREAGVRKILLIGGEASGQSGPYADAAAVLREGLLAEYGVREVGLAGYPEGHPAIPGDVLERALLEKLELAKNQGLGTYLVTQFSFAPGRIVEYCTGLGRRIPKLPVYVGIAGPTEPLALLRYAQRCGVSASLRALRAQGFDAVRLVTHTDPGDQLAALARYCRARSQCNVVGVHFFSFGGAATTATWMNQAIQQR
ncbi:MAG: methylenetetrahydrofolate reductase [Betaproteobacteria bacterium]|nr:methylenetetrahydrofolate reductase [Betaproteobacteria bacterium]